MFLYETSVTRSPTYINGRTGLTLDVTDSSYIFPLSDYFIQKYLMINSILVVTYVPLIFVSCVLQHSEYKFRNMYKYF
jgi:hypothetical protein